MASRNPFLMYGWYKSSCTGRLRIALNYKKLPYDYQSVRLKDGEQLEPAHKALNPSATVPVLVDQRPGMDGTSFPILQSIAALEYLEETCPDSPPLLPPLSQPLARAKVRTLVAVIASDTQPRAHRTIVKHIATFNQSTEEWMKTYLHKGLSAYESIASKTAGRYSVGDDLSMADVCLLPCIWNAEKADVDVAKYPTIMRIVENMNQLESVKQAHWTRQSDTPADLGWY